MTEAKIINRDWFAFSVVLVPSDEEKQHREWAMTEPEGYQLYHMTGTNIYRQRAILYNDHGEKMLTLLWEPCSKIIRYDSMLVEVANKWLYGSSFFWVWEILQQIHTCVFNNVSRLDLCCDFNPSKEQMGIIRGLSSNKIYVAKKRNGSMFHEYTPAGEDGARGISRIPLCMSWGSLHTAIKFKLYDKSKELYTIVKKEDGFVKICNKPYIEAIWRKNGLDVDKVWRLEVSLMEAGQYDNDEKKIDLNMVQSDWMIEQLFWDMYKKRFITRKNEGHRDLTNDKQVFLLGKPKTYTKLTRKDPETQKEIVEAIAALRAAVAQLQKPEIACYKAMRDTWRDAAIKTAKLGHLENYFARTYGMPLEQIEDLIPKGLPIADDKKQQNADIQPNTNWMF